ncbi:hypothetical protein HMPREF9073_02668 [Capnocytophaga sp. oral taxon 326 str. F0382]|nr:hypothetical protein HMPREF9073_02668 [Capnocytophaga sp. oral taxon 326 str. F0382]
MLRNKDISFFRFLFGGKNSAFYLKCKFCERKNKNINILLVA